MSSLQFAKLNLDMIALNIQSLESASERNEALDMLAQLAQDLEKSNQVETVFQNYKNQLLRTSHEASQELLIMARPNTYRPSEQRALDEEKYKCQQCGKCFPRASKLARHANSQLGCTFVPDEVKPIQCPEISVEKSNKVFQNYKNQLLRTSESVVASPQELPTMAVSKRLRTSEKKALLEEKYKCQRCGKCFPSASKLERHSSSSRGCTLYMLETDESNAFQCQECYHRTNTQDGLTRHRIKHTDRYKCMECGRGFSSPRDQEKHQRNPKNCLKFITLLQRSSSL